MTKRAEWYTDDRLGAWDRIKAAFANDWEQTKRDFGSKSARDLDQDVDDTVKQALGSSDAFENREQAFRFGYTARSEYGGRFPDWNETLDDRLRADYEGDYDADRGFGDDAINSPIG
jgi:hypothetical protein